MDVDISKYNITSGAFDKFRRHSKIGIHGYTAKGKIFGRKIDMYVQTVFLNENEREDEFLYELGRYLDNPDLYSGKTFQLKLL